MCLGTYTVEVVEQGTDTGEIVLEGGRVDLGDIGEGDGRDVAGCGSSVGGGCGGSGSKETGADYGWLEESRNSYRGWSGLYSGRGMNGQSVPFWPASLTVWLARPAWISNEPPIEFRDNVLALDPRRDGLRWTESGNGYAEADADAAADRREKVSSLSTGLMGDEDMA